MILLIDSYDSFTNNLAQLIKRTTQKKVVIIHNDTFKPSEYESFRADYLPHFEYLVIGPGPGSPGNQKDTGIITWLLNQYRDKEQFPAIPILGICLGYQCICHVFGCEVNRLDKVRHGQIFDICPVDTGNNPLYPPKLVKDGQKKYSFPSVRYHSLYVDHSSLSQEIIPLAYCLDEHNSESKSILMAARHRDLPFYGVQYHPESICSSEGEELIKTFDSLATCFNNEHRAERRTGINDLSIGLGSDMGLRDVSAVLIMKLKESRKTFNFNLKKFKLQEGLQDQIRTIDMCNYVREHRKEDFMVLNSASFPGKWSIIAFPTRGYSNVITHSVENPHLLQTLSYGSNTKNSIQLEAEQTIWDFIGNLFSEKYIPREQLLEQFEDNEFKNIPFLGGYMGFVSYEEGRDIIVNKVGSFCTEPTPDLKLVHIEKFLIHNNSNDTWYIGFSSLENDHSEWCQSLHKDILEAYNNKELKIDDKSISSSIKSLVDDRTESIDFELPNREIYKKQFELCQEYLHSGDSYELCLTTQLKIKIPSKVDPWEIYKILSIHRNPSPFSCYMEFDDSTLISSSPERFLSWNTDAKESMVELRPIKGTVKRSGSMDFEKASKILNTPKEIGENLMIVDLIRHDLYQFSENVSVPSLMQVEEYKTVYQLVSVIQGHLDRSLYRGLDVLHRSLPPGSMTGAPKIRSVHLLQDIEGMQPMSSNLRRGIYSGVAGYWSITDDSDWSVIIRSLFHYAKDKENTTDTSIWRIGAGGAITVLSDPEEEWNEMITKLSSVLLMFS